MPQTLFVPKETASSEQRVAASPDTVKKLIALGYDVSVESGAGVAATYTDASYKDAGAKITKERIKADIVLKVQVDKADIENAKAGAVLIGQYNPYQNADLIALAEKKGVTALAMELVPRITRAQSMDVLSSQANLAGYKAVLDACEYYGRAFPMMMTAAGTVPPAKVFVMGAGVAGLQAIATAKRLGAVVSATDVRPAAKEQVKSLGGSFVAVEDEEFKEAESAGGYAKEMSAAYKKKQAELVAEHIKKQDIVITTALIPGRPAPELLSEAMVKSMKEGSVIVDLAAVQGGNCALTEKGKVKKVGGVTIIGHENFPSRLAADTSALYAKNLLNLLTLITDKEKKVLAIDWNDDIVKGIALTNSGALIHPNFKDKKSTPTPPKSKPTSTRKASTAAAEKPKTLPKAKTKSAATTSKKPAAKKTPAKTTQDKKS